jgi:hypothetical protein
MLYMAQMVYAEVAFDVEMDWSNIPTSFWSQQKKNLHHIIPWSIETQPNPGLNVSGPSKVFGSKQSLMMPHPLIYLLMPMTMR